MKYLKIKNRGILDIRLVALMGGTTKANDQFKIGQFGTGLKYTLAFLVRNNTYFRIFAGEQEIGITTEQEVIGDETFNIICINGHRTSITDKMGYDWKAWMIIRELWCNALDEGGSERAEVYEATGEADHTTFYIQVTPEIQEVLNDWGKYFIHDKEPMFSNERCAVYPGGPDLRIYKQGVLIKEMKNKKSLYSYDLRNAQINELREYVGSSDRAVFECLKVASPDVIRYFLENVSEEHYEGSDCSLDWWDHFGDQWKETIGTAKIIHPEAVSNIRARGIEVDQSNFLIVPKKIYEVLTKQFDGIGALRISSKINEFYESFLPELEEKIKQALVILEECGYNFSPELKFVYGVFGAKDIQAQVCLDKKEVYISENILHRSMFEVVSILIEESEHFKTGHEDCSRQFQTHFLHLYTQQLLKSAEVAL